MGITMSSFDHEFHDFALLLRYELVAEADRTKAHERNGMGGAEARDMMRGEKDGKKNPLF